ncbi:hypothetical protein PSA7680_02750 [Pseudoruegeria aquimaris]|uniref:Uncharacterized protein n=1 Tax=Pseudoruegeria aquimaris TaxID=393663 RepID=A0A1Y5SZW3_9RHOB|nr:hypothetical protein [Pseudoruegeria aquimaris]SLN52462.1 hypothetical protein PSA7680_02750 [Pseudoruegeria aquimaris]
MSAPARFRGAAPVGVLEDLALPEAFLVRLMRQWADSPAQRRQAQRDLTIALGFDAGAHAAEALRAFQRCLARHARRPLMQHGLSCQCLGADECALSHLVAAAAAGDRQDSRLFTSLLVSGSAVTELMDLAETLGRALRAQAVPEPSYRPSGHRPTSTLH